MDPFCLFSENCMPSLAQEQRMHNDAIARTDSLMLVETETEVESELAVEAEVACGCDSDDEEDGLRCPRDNSDHEDNQVDIPEELVLADLAQDEADLSLDEIDDAVEDVIDDIDDAMGDAMEEFEDLVEGLYDFDSSSSDSSDS